MKKWFIRIAKILGYSFLGIFLLLWLATWIIPMFFSNDIKAMIDKEVQKQVNADVHYKIEDFSLSVFRSFPFLSLGQDNVSITNKKDSEFKGDTLCSFKQFRLSLNIWAVIWTGEAQLRAIYLGEPRIFARMNANGKANWDIMIPQPPDTVKKEDKPAKYQASIGYWQIENGHLVYDDRLQKIYTKIDKFSHSGSGNFNQDVFDLSINNSFDKINVVMGGEKYLEDKTLNVDMTLNMNLPEQKYTFKDNTIRLNDFAVGIDGFVQLLKDNTTRMDITYKAKENEFKNILSLVPYMFTKDFKNLKTSGKLAFEGFVKGIFGNNKMPAFGLKAQIKDGMFQYPSLPTPVNNVQMDLAIDNKDGVIDNTNIDLNKFHVDLGKNPVDIKAKIQTLTNMKVDAKALAKINLADLMQMFPMQGFTLKGNYDLDATIKGIFNATTKQMPSIDAAMSLANGYAKTSQFPEALEQMTAQASVKNATGKFEDFKVKVSNFNMVVDKEPFKMSGSAENLADIKYDVKAKGVIDMGKITKIFPLDKTKLLGRIFADVENNGQMSFLTKGQYDKIKTSGLIKINDLEYNHKEYLPQGFKITKGEANFTPKALIVKSFVGFLGNSDYAVKGDLNNYIAYIFQGETLQGKMDLNIDNFDADEWVTKTPTPTNTPTNNPTNNNPAPNPNTNKPTTNTPPAQGGVAQIPTNVDFDFNADIKKIKYATTPITNLKGNILVKNGILNVNKINFNMIGAAFNTTFVYNPTDKLRPKYSIDFGIQDLFLSNAYKAYDAKSKLSDNYGGKINSLFKVSGELGQDMMPKYDKSMNGSIALNVMQALIKDEKIMKQLGNFIKLKEVLLKDFLVKGEIKDGKVNYQPFNIQAGDYKMAVSGNNSIDGNLDFKIKMDVPTEKLSMIGATTVSALTGKTLSGLDKIALNIGVGGMYNNPSFNLLSSDGKPIGNIKEAVKEKVKETINEKKEEVIAKVKEDLTPKIEAIMSKARATASEIKAKAREASDQIKQEADKIYNQALDEAYKKGYDEAPFAKEKAGNLAKKLADKVAIKPREEAYKRADQITNEADKRAEQVIAEGQAQADKLK